MGVTLAFEGSPTPEAQNPNTDADFPAGILAPQVGGVTEMLDPAVVTEPFHELVSFAPAGSVKVSFQLFV